LEKALPFGLWKGKVFDEAAEILARLLAGETLCSEDIPIRTVTRQDFRSEEEWQAALAVARRDGVVLAGQAAPAKPPMAPIAPNPGSVSSLQSVAATAGDGSEQIVLPKRFVFEHLKIVPQEFRRDLLQLVVGSHDPKVHALVNRFLP